MGHAQEGRYCLGYSVCKHITLCNAPVQTHLCCQCFSYTDPQHCALSYVPPPFVLQITHMLSLFSYLHICV